MANAHDLLMAQRAAMMAKSGGIPSEYEMVKNIRTSGHQRIDTGIDVSGGYRLTCRVMITGSSGNTHAIFGGYGTSPYNRCQFAFARNQSGVLMGFGGSAYQYFGAWEPGVYYDVDVCNKHGEERLFVNEEFDFNPVGQVGTFFNDHQPLFCEYEELAFQSYATCVMDWIKIFTDGIALDYVPCVRRSDSVAGFYDFVSRTFKTNDGFGTFGYQLADGTIIRPT